MHPDPGSFDNPDALRLDAQERTVEGAERRMHKGIAAAQMRYAEGIRKLEGERSEIISRCITEEGLSPDDARSVADDREMEQMQELRTARDSTIEHARRICAIEQAGIRA